MFQQGGRLSSASSLTNLHNEPDYCLQRTHSASEVFDTSYGSGSGGRRKGKQRAKDLRHSIADSRSDYYNNRRPQSLCLCSQIPAHSTLQLSLSISALGTISENEAVHGSSPNVVETDGGSIFSEPPDTPLFHYTPALALSEVDLQSKGSSSQQRIGVSKRPTEQGECQPNSPVTTETPIHASEPITQQFVPLYLNPLTGQMYSQNSDYFRPISNPDELITTPPKPDKRFEEKLTVPASYIKFTQLLALLFLVCGNILVLATCSLPALLCAYRVHQLNMQKQYGKAKKRSEYVLCFNIVGIALHIVLMTAIIATVVFVFVHLR